MIAAITFLSLKEKKKSSKWLTQSFLTSLFNQIYFPCGFKVHIDIDIEYQGPTTEDRNCNIYFSYTACETSIFYAKLTNI